MTSIVSNNTSIILQSLRTWYHWLPSLVGCHHNIGASLYRSITNSYGLLRTLQLLDLLTILASCIGTISFSLFNQMISRMLLGLVVGINSIAIPTYLTSCLPGSMRSSAGTLNQLFIAIGIFCGFWFGLGGLNSNIDELGWRVIIIFPIFPSIIRLYALHTIFP